MRIFRKYMLLALVFPLLASCGGDGACKSMLHTADSLIEEQPDSSLAMLRRDSALFLRAGKAVHMAYTLTKTEAEDKLYITHTSDSAMLPATEYFSAHGTPLQRARSCYVLGRVYCDMRLYGHALSAFDKALAVDGGNGPALCRYKARAAMWAGDVYEGRSLHDKALQYNKLSYKYAKKADVPSVEVYSLRDIGRSYSYLKRNDVAIPYYKRAAMKAEALNDAYLYNMVMEELAVIYIEEDRVGDARKALSVPFNSTNAENIAPHCFTWAMYYERINRLDSAIYYNKKGMEYAPVASNRDASLDLARLYEKAGDKFEALAYYKLYADYADSVAQTQVIEYADFMSGMERLLDIERKNAALASSRLRLTIILSVLILTVIAASLALTRTYFKRKRKIKEQQERVRRYRQQQRLRELQSTQRNIERIKELEKELSTSNKTFTSLRKELIRSEAEMLKRRDEQMAFEHKHGELLVSDFADTDVYKLYHSPTAVPTSADYHKLAEALNKAYNDFTDRLKEFYPDITAQEMWVCCMVKTGLSAKEICGISTYSASSLSMAKSRLYSKMFHKKGSSKEFDAFIRGF